MSFSVVVVMTEFGTFSDREAWGASYDGRVELPWSLVVLLTIFLGKYGVWDRRIDFARFRVYGW